MEGSNRNRVLTCYYRPKPGGFCTRYFRAINALLDKGCEVHYLAVVRFPIDRSNCHFHRFPWPRNRTDTLFFWAVFHILAPFILTYLGFRWRITHCFAFGANYGCFLQPLRMIKQTPLVLFLRGDSLAHHGTRNSPDWLMGLELLIEGLAINHIRVYCVSDFLGQRLAARHRWLRPLSIAILRNDINLKSPVKKPSMGDRLRLGCVGMLEPHKNQALLIDVLSRLNNDTVTLDIFGVGPDRDRLIGMAKRLGIQPQVNLRGWIDANRIWQEIDLLLMPSLYEGCPNAVLEAMGHSIPVLASEIPAHREILPETSCLPADIAEAWYIRLKPIADNPNKEAILLLESQSEKMDRMVFDWDKNICDAIIERKDK